MTSAVEGTPQPFFSSTAAEASPKRPRLLLVSYHFPPDIAVGGLRWQELARYVVARGWALDVITRHPLSLAVRDEARLRRLPNDVRVYGVVVREHRVAALPTRIWRSLRRWFPRKTPRPAVELRRDELGNQSLSLQIVRGYLAWLDFVHQGMWAKRAARAAAALTRSTDYAAVVTSGPPHMAHEAGRLIASRAGIPLVLDFRDPWSMQERVGEQMASPIWFKLAERHERRVVDAAALIAMNTDQARDAMRARYPETAERIITVRNGCDDDPLPRVRKERRFSIRFAGEIYVDRDPRLVFRASARVVRELGLTPSEFGLEFIGDVARFQGLPLEEIARREELVGFVETGPFRPRNEALEFLAGAAMLLSLPQDSHLAIPAKIFEYLRFDAWLLILAQGHSATAALLRGTDADVVPPNDVDRIAEVIRRRYEQYARGERPRAIGTDGRFDRKIQADLLLKGIENVVRQRQR